MKFIHQNIKKKKKKMVNSDYKKEYEHKRERGKVFKSKIINKLGFDPTQSLSYIQSKKQYYKIIHAIDALRVKKMKSEITIIKNYHSI